MWLFLQYNEGLWMTGIFERHRNSNVLHCAFGNYAFKNGLQVTLKT
ncbi:MAG: hypothetical protein OFPI_44720 [Osedax symbiont Rs2]|nr:MAG: hypothetical protein OFPI_44720 [Osedax symbiont Rs2]